CLSRCEVDYTPKTHNHRYPTRSIINIYQAISTLSITTPPITPTQVPLVDSWLQSVLWDSTFPALPSGAPGPANFDIHRLKGILAIDDGSSKIIQAVREIFEIRDAAPTQDQEPKTQCKIVLIGRGLGVDAAPWQASFEAFLQRK
ncbi:hypothetical protein BO71DRAFT_43223, partial [Aspergillus ellipticus CBS 707.79]